MYKAIIKASCPSNRYHDIDGEEVEILSSIEYKGKEVWTFYHKNKGFGAMYSYGFIPK